MNNSSKKKLLIDMIRFREVEKKIQSEYGLQEMRCPIHLSIGQEAISAGISNNLIKKDKVLSAHRSHFHYLGKGGSLKKMISEFYGKESGCAMGLGGSMHLIDLSNNFLAAVPIVGSTLPIGIGIAWANKLKKLNNIVTVIYFGDGATEEGAFYESLNFASLFNLNVLFICENNFFSVYSNILKRRSDKTSITKIAEAHNIKSIKMNGNYCEDIFLKSKEIISEMRKKTKPFLIEFETYRHTEHCGPNYDDILNYREKKEVDYWLNLDPIKIYKKKLFKEKIINKKELDKKVRIIRNEITEAFNFAKKSKYPNKDILKKLSYS